MAKPIRVQLDQALSDIEILAVSRLNVKKSVEDAREKARRGLHDVDVTVRITGDLEVGLKEQTPEKVPYSEIAQRALALLSPADRKRAIGSGRLPAADVLLAKQELETLAASMPKHTGPAKLTPHLQVAKVSAAMKALAA